LSDVAVNVSLAFCFCRLFYSIFCFHSGIRLRKKKKLRIKWGGEEKRREREAQNLRVIVSGAELEILGGCGTLRKMGTII